MTKKAEPEMVEVTARVKITSSPFGSHEIGDKFYVPAERVEKLERDGFIETGGKKAAARDGNHQPDKA